ncbi:hypothetical protein WL057_17750 [Vibrio alginolyticus]|uniref:hypothetical protein n=1 Tax=Vibrio alginolyticus TaxID=663 RepID=UPI00215E5F75|nr:hypothetical protein [Vibrio alginolyticus]MCS0080800.1 hypothetical protein [Vibrio alginolyticus]
MNLSELKQQLKTQCLELYLSKSDTDYFTAPEFYSPLYRYLYEGLISGEMPPYFKEAINRLDDSKRKLVRDNIKQCHTTFDRYLSVLYPSKFEASNPLKLDANQTKEKELLAYLHSNYNRATDKRDSYKLSREFNNVLSLVPENRAKWFKENAKSSLYKMVVLSHKLSLINSHWRQLINYIEPDGKIKNASMDNVVDFNLLENNKARLNSAIVKMFYFEIDQGKPDGFDTESRRILMLPYYINRLSKLVKEILYGVMESNPDSTVMFKEMSDMYVYFFKRTVEDVKSSNKLKYDDSNLELFDIIQHSVIINLQSNSILAKKRFESILDYNLSSLVNERNWISKEHSDAERCNLVELELALPEGAVLPEWLDVSNTLSKILHKSNNCFGISGSCLKNLCLLIIADIHVKGSFYITSNIKGPVRNDYVVYNELKMAHDWIKENDPELDDKHSLSIMRPTSIHFFEYVCEKIYFSMFCKDKKISLDVCSYEVFRNVYFDMLHKMLRLIRLENHIVSLKSIEDFYAKSNPFSRINLESDFLNYMDDDNLITKAIVREYMMWSPIEYL